jgi:hypothetical protein
LLKIADALGITVSELTQNLENDFRSSEKSQPLIYMNSIKLLIGVAVLFLVALSAQAQSMLEDLIFESGIASSILQDQGGPDVSIAGALPFWNAAPRPVQLRPGRDYLVRMQDGVLVTGRVVAGGRPVPGAVVFVRPTVSVDGEFFTSDKVTTDANGCFSLFNLPPKKGLTLFASMDSLQGKGALPPRQFSSGTNKATTDLGELVLLPGYLVAGQILLSDGNPVPAHTRLLLAREGVSDYSEAVLDAGGRFEFQTVPAESVSLGLRLKGYRFSKINPSLDWLNGPVVGTVNRDITNLTLIMEPGEFRYTPDTADLPEGVDRQPRDKPLRSAKPF